MKAFRMKFHSVLIKSIQNNNLLATLRCHGFISLFWHPTNMVMQRNDSYVLSIHKFFIQKMRNLSYDLFFITISQQILAVNNCALQIALQ